MVSAMGHPCLCWTLIAMVSASATPAAAAWRFATPAWSGVAETYPGGLHTRDDGQALLIRRPGAAIYRFDPRRASLAPASESDWAAAGTVSDCEAQRQMAGYRLDSRDGILRGKAGALAIPGFVVQTLQSPGARYGAVLAAAGRGRSLLPFFGGGGGRGPYRHYLVSMADGAVLGGGIALQLAGPAVRMCWSADERFVLYTDLDFGNMTVVPVPP
jgi:hypothetical protein